MTDRLIDPTTDFSMFPRSRCIVTIQQVLVNVQRVKEWKRVRDEGQKLYEYVTTDAVTETTEKIYEQVVDSLDIVDVIKAVNSSGILQRHDLIEQATRHPEEWKPGPILKTKD